jgi:NAD(P)-dependent dehydrogenase (short-subunit alcohol dehydrogenase family)
VTNPRVAWVTGGASGLGRIIALRMARAGTRVALLDLDEERLHAVASEHENLRAYPGDVCDAAAMNDVAGAIERDLGSIERVVHCAAIMPTGPLATQPIESIHRLMRVNYGGTVNVTKAALPRLLERGSGELVLFGSTGGSVLVPECGAYCASKAATNAFAEVLIEENRGSGVHVMLVCPPLVDTPLLEQAVETSNPKSIRDSIASRRFADPEHVIDAVERGLARRTEILLTDTEARLVTWARRLAPGLLWKVLHRVNR